MVNRSGLTAWGCGMVFAAPAAVAETTAVGLEVVSAGLDILTEVISIAVGCYLMDILIE